MKDIGKNIIGSLISAICFAIIFSIWNDNFYKKDQLGGHWEVQFETHDSSYSKYIGLVTSYEMVIGQKGNTLSGVGEKISEYSKSKGFYEYETHKRAHLTIDGSITYFVFSKNQVNLIHKETGRKRPSSTVINLGIQNENEMTGTFISTVASSKGIVTFKRVQKI